MLDLIQTKTLPEIHQWCLLITDTSFCNILVIAESLFPISRHYHLKALARRCEKGSRRDHRRFDKSAHYRRYSKAKRDSPDLSLPSLENADYVRIERFPGLVISKIDTHGEGGSLETKLKLVRAGIACSADPVLIFHTEANVSSDKELCTGQGIDTKDR